MARFWLFAVAPTLGLASWNQLVFGVDGGLLVLLEEKTGHDGINCHSAIYSLNNDGSLKWRSEPEDRCVGDFQEGVDGNVYVRAAATSLSSDMLFYALDGSDGSVKWQIPYGGLDVGNLEVTDNAVYVHHGSVATDTVVDAIDKAGAVKGTWHFDCSRGCSESDVGPDGSVVVHSSDSSTRLMVLSQEIGKVKWSFENENEDLGSWAMSKDGIFMTRENSAGRRLNLIHLNWDDGAVSWNVSLSVSQTVLNLGWGNVLGSNGEAYVNGVDKDGVCSLLAFDVSGNSRSMPCIPIDGYAEWEIHHATLPNEDGTQEDMFIYTDVRKQCVDCDEQVIPELGAHVFAYSGTTGNLLWNVSLPGEDLSYLELQFGQDGTVFAFGGDDVTAIRNGVVAWRDKDIGRPSLIAKDGISYLDKGNSGRASSIVALDKDGAQMWSFDPASVPLPSMAVV